MPDPAKADEKRPDDTGFSGPRLWITVGLLLALVAFVVYMLAGADTASETLWNRQVYLFGGFEAIVFTAVGWLFGREVHRSSAASAKAEAEEAKQKADAATLESSVARQQAAEEQAKGKAMKAAVMALASPAGTGSTRGTRSTRGTDGAEEDGDRPGPLGTPSARPGSTGAGGPSSATTQTAATQTAVTQAALMQLAEDLWPDA